ncbi:hypothetical protein SMD11_6251 [Streptomyces albireticuli]|uniref:Lipoprotein n=1 Tax=Streptomyces albireticuli TaxID=1940 RepID=A0A1Z2LC00_9ACTN|nr:hypothetical protein [Streptomyces albireticuli]ARZ71827.1 hypothetical protein SMD11_6251 [Streptomyces albireticuli]
MKFAPRSLLIPLLLAGVAAPLAAFPAAADPGGSGHQAPPVVGAGDGPADKEAVSVVRPGADGKVTQVPVGGARLTGYDATGGHAVLTGARASDGAGSGAGTPAQLRVGDVIASPVTAVTPHGALVKVTATHPGAGGSVTVDTAPADLTEALGDAKADVRTPLTAADLKTKPLTQGGHVSTGPSDGQGIRLDVDVPVPPGVKPTAGHSSALSGHLDLKPEMLFSYERAHWYSVQPSKAEIGLSADYTYEVKAHAEGSASYDTGRKPLRIPAAEVDVDKTVWLGPVPIVLTMKVDYFYDVSADGKISVDAEQRSTGRLEAGARYDADKGWSALSGPEPATTGTPARVEGSATAKAGIGTHAQLGLYGSVGVAADFMPYLKATAHGVAGDGSAPKTGAAKADAPQGVNGDWAVYAGADLTGSFFAKLAVFGVKVLDHTWEFPKVTYEHKLAGSDS